MKKSKKPSSLLEELSSFVSGAKRGSVPGPCRRAMQRQSSQARSIASVLGDVSSSKSQHIIRRTTPTGPIRVRLKPYREKIGKLPTSEAYASRAYFGIWFGPLIRGRLRILKPYEVIRIRPGDEWTHRQATDWITVQIKAELRREGIKAEVINTKDYVYILAPS